MTKTIEERLDDEADAVGVALSETEDKIRELFNTINMRPDLDSEGEKRLFTLKHVRDLLNIAVELYPFPYGDERPYVDPQLRDDVALADGENGHPLVEQ